MATYSNATYSNTVRIICVYVSGVSYVHLGIRVCVCARARARARARVCVCARAHKREIHAEHKSGVFRVFRCLATPQSAPKREIPRDTRALLKCFHIVK